MPASNAPRQWPGLMLAAAAALSGALALYYLGVPGSLVVGGTIGAGIVAVTRNHEVLVPPALRNAIQILVGVMVGTRVTPQVVSELPRYLLPAAATAILMVIGGVVLARLMHRWAGMPPWIVLATCPGALEALVSVAGERQEGAVEVSLFHLVRIIAVVLSIPVLVQLV